MADLIKEFEGHDHYVYEVNKTYTGSNFLHVAKAPSGTIAGSSRVQHLSIHIDDLDALVYALKELRNR